MTTLEIERRTATPVAVDFPKRMIELIVMPYETEAQVVHKGRLIREIVTRGAFQGLDADHRRILVNRRHVIEDVIGRATKFHLSREEGLVAEVKIVRGDDGDSVLYRADEGLLDASAGFGVPDGGEAWPERGLRRLNRVWLDHIAMTADPAYKTARVLAVRDSQDEPADRFVTPNLDKVRGWQLADRYATLGLTTER